MPCSDTACGVPGQGPTDFVEKYCKEQLKHKGIGVEAHFLVVEYGQGKGKLKGEEAINKLPSADRLKRISKLQDNFFAEAVDSEELDMELVTFVRFPSIQ
eukprot:1073080-Rhodomonas_salina.1